MSHFKKIALAAGVAAFVAVSPVAAKKLGGEIAVGGWQHDPSGWIEYNPNDVPGDNRVDADDDLHLDTQTDFYARAKFEHPIPILPNIRVAYVHTETTGDGRLSKTFTFDDQVYVANEEIHSEAKLDNVDGTLYYEVVDMDSFDLDLGLTARYMDGYVKVEDKTRNKSSQADVNFVVPMVYANIRIAMPFLEGLSVGVEGNGVGYSGNALYDVHADVRYIVFAGLGVEAGYRYQKVKIDDIDDVSADIDIQGAYAGVVWDF